MKKGWISIILSLIFPGLGHLYLGRVKKGVLLLAADIVSVLLMSVIIGVFLLPIVLIYSVIDAYKLTNVVNEEIYTSRA
jgi:TM2 domain-containing membrane protein YozV